MGKIQITEHAELENMPKNLLYLENTQLSLVELRMISHTEIINRVSSLSYPRDILNPSCR